MTDVSHIVVTSVEEHEDGSATYQLYLDEGSTEKLANLGVELVVYCAAAGLDIQEVFDWILEQAKLKDLQDEGS